VSKHFLLPLFKKVDMVEQDKTFVDQAPIYLVHTPCLWSQYDSGDDLLFDSPIKLYCSPDEPYYTILFYSV
jgi:hypothetical protein